jgi:pyridinium-3,5-biscarboxylic acid mononucleotide sulfurtransferase
MTHNVSVNPESEVLEARLKEIVAGYPKLLVAYSGGVDSTYLADVAHEVLGQNAEMVLMDSPSLPRAEWEEAGSIARARVWNFTIITTAEFDCPDFTANTELRCYYCKRARLAELCRYAASRGIAHVAHGENADDWKDSGRVGHRAAVEAGAVAPLAEAGLTKERIRELSQRRGLPTWNKLSFSCLATRFPQGTPIDRDALPRIEAAESALRRRGFRQFRARHHDDVCRIELEPAEFRAFLDDEFRAALVAELKNAGYRYVTLDLAGYRLGGSAGGVAIC